MKAAQDIETRPRGRRLQGVFADLGAAAAACVSLALAVAFVAAAGAAATSVMLDGPLSNSWAIALLAFVAVATAGGLIGALISHRHTSRAVAEIRRLGSLFDVLDEGILVCNGMQIVAANTRIRELTGHTGQELEHRVIGSFIHDIEVVDALLSDEPVTLETTMQTREREMLAVEITARNIEFAGQPRRLLEVRDIRERKESAARISFLAHHDALTGLPNREVLHTRLDQAIIRSRQTGESCAIIWIDLDRFKEINDIFGHATGDRTLCAVAEKLKFELPADALIARVGGDEFVVLCEALVDAAEARLIGQQLRRLLNRPLDLGERSVRVGASIGVAVFPGSAETADELMRNADLALYHAKAAGRARCRQFDDDLAREFERRVVLSGQLRDAIDGGAIKTWFQPLVRARDGVVTAFEALARWDHPDYGFVPPSEFVRIAEENGLISRLTDVVARGAIDAARQWPDTVRICVNVSPLQINSDLVDQLRELLQESGFDPRRLELEVTENTLINDFEQTSSMFARLRAMGIHVAMDDFGAGHTSMAHLRLLNFDRIKIDRIFTADLPGHRRSAAIVRSMLVLARELDLEVTVEGVETADQLAFLRTLGCGEIQGYLFSPPKPVEAWTPEAIADLKRMHVAVVGNVGRDDSLIEFDKRRPRLLRGSRSREEVPA